MDATMSMAEAKRIIGKLDKAWAQRLDTLALLCRFPDDADVDAIDPSWLARWAKREGLSQQQISTAMDVYHD